MQVAIIGAGPLGRWLAFASARAGYRVLLEDVMPSNLHHAQEYLRQQLGPGALPMVEFASTIEGAVREADLAIDCVPDELESKLEIFCLLDRMAPPRTVFISPMTQLSIADLASCTYRADKCVALVAKVEELAEASIGGSHAGEQERAIRLRTPPQITAETVAIVREFWERIGFAPHFEADISQ
jgi:3-hydroxybutyryl-CoA dehydrogenase